MVRKLTGLANSKLNEVIHEDFNDLSAIAENFENQDIVFYCLGVYTGVVDRDAFRIFRFLYPGMK